MNYGNYSPRFIHQEFGEIIRDLKLNTLNPKRNQVKWRETANEHYIQGNARFEDQEPNYSHHKIEGKRENLKIEFLLSRTINM
jgi:hypothetical protein